MSQCATSRFGGIDPVSLKRPFLGGLHSIPWPNLVLFRKNSEVNMTTQNGVKLSVRLSHQLCSHLRNGAKAFGVALAAWASCAFSVSPIVLDLDSLGPKSAAQITVTNPGTVGLPVEVVLTEVILDGQGKAMERRTNPQDFIIMPPLDTIGGGKARVFTLQYIGQGDIPSSRYFEFSVDQVPVGDPKGEVAVQIVYSISGIMAVGPMTGRSAISVANAQVAQTDDGKPAAKLVLRNTGNRHDYLSRGTVSLTFTNNAGRTTWRQTLRGSDIRQAIGAGILPAQTTKEVLLPLVNGGPSELGTLTAVFSSSSQPSRAGRQ